MINVLVDLNSACSDYAIASTFNFLYKHNKNI